MKSYKDFKKKLKEQEGGAPANNVGSGNIAGVGVGPAGEPGVKPKDGIVGQGFGKRRKKDKVIMGMIKRNIKENFDNNNVILKQILDGLDKVDNLIDFKNTGKVGIPGVIIEKKEPRKNFKQKYHINENIDSALIQKELDVALDSRGNTKYDLKKALNMLPNDRMKKMIQMRFLDNMTYDQIGKEFNLSRERVRQIIFKTLRILKHPGYGLSRIIGKKI